MNETFNLNVETKTEKSQVFDQTPLDEKWYGEFEKIGAFQAYEYFDGDKKNREVEKNKFLSGEVVNPKLDYPKLNEEDLQLKFEALITLRKKIRKEEANLLIRQVYIWKLNEKICEIRLMQATLHGKMRLFDLFSEEVYGAPQADIFAFTIKNLQAEIDKALVSETSELQKVAAELRDMLPRNLVTPKIQELPTASNIAEAKDRVETQMADLLTLPEEKKYQTDEIKAVFEMALGKLRAEGWKVEILTQSSRSGLSVNHEKKLVEIPEKMELTAGRLKELLAHEIGTHVQRRVNGERSRLKLLGLGLAGYEKGEEGLATMAEQVLGKEASLKDFAGMQHYLSISLARGVDGQPRDFRQTYEIMEKYHYFKMLKSGKEVNFKKAQDSAWSSCVRVFRGTDCKTKGVCFTKDIIYREGNIGVWEVITKNAEEMIRFYVGKYDPANPRHLFVLDTLAITDADVKRLESLVSVEYGRGAAETRKRVTKRVARHKEINL